jgi:hypothetical protein
VTDQYHNAFLKIPQLTPCNNAHISACSCSRKTIQQIASPPSTQNKRPPRKQHKGELNQDRRIADQTADTPRAPGYRRHQNFRGHDIRRSVVKRWLLL